MTSRPPDEMHWAGIQPANESRQICGMSGGRKVLPRVRPCGRTVVTKIIGHEPVLCGNSPSLWLPIAEVHPSSVNKDDWYARALFDVEEIDAVRLKLTHHSLLLLAYPGA